MGSMDRNQNQEKKNQCRKSVSQSDKINMQQVSRTGKLINIAKCSRNKNPHLKISMNKTIFIEEKKIDVQLWRKEKPTSNKFPEDKNSKKQVPWTKNQHA